MTTKITKILIANRGEIACRVIRTARKMGIKTVAVYSDADHGALHVRMADEAVHIGPSSAAESYLIADKIIAAAQQTGADAVHPGYGFLSENPAFVRACHAANITFIGPSAEAMEAMGLKDAAKALMTNAGVPVTPGYQGDDQDADHLAEQAGLIGYPVLIKAVAGGGGKGMRKVEASEDFKDALASCQREATASFGNDVVLIEKYIQSPRHIEVQVFGDAHGNVVHMFERDCSLQRRHQKVIEEAPAPGMTDDVRAVMTTAAVRAAQAVNYQGAGTVEFIVDGSGALRTDGFWFMEMNTRLQVEHPVTEEITGLDLVEWQIRVARGEALPDQSEITLKGHAVEARIYAEDPSNDFLPSVGLLSTLKWNIENKTGGERHRVDTGVQNHDRISINYDPMIAKVIAHSDGSRDQAIEELRGALATVELRGLKTNIGYLYNILAHPKFIEFNVDTTFIAENHNSILGPNLYEYDALYLLAAQMMIFRAHRVQKNSKNPFYKLNGWRNNSEAVHQYNFTTESGSKTVSVLNFNDDSITGYVDSGETFSINKFEYHNLSVDIHGNDLVSALKAPEYWWYHYQSGELVLHRNGSSFSLRMSGADSASSAPSGNAVTAPMPGKVIDVLVEPGATVTADQPLIILEAMKMEMTLKSPRDGVVTDVSAAIGQLVTDGQALVSLEEE
jgi:3-methylcrotonyl-CoA carboxylase alpha subunit